MRVYELRIPAASDPRLLEAIRWELFAFPQVRDVHAAPRPGIVAVAYEGESPAPAEWIEALVAAGYEVEVAEQHPEPAV